VEISGFLPVPKTIRDGEPTFMAMFEKTWPFSLSLAGFGLVGNIIKGSKFVHDGEPK